MSGVLDFLPQWHYLAILAFCILVTLPLEVVLGARVYRLPKRLAITIVAAATPFVIWDYLAIRAEHWWISEDHTLPFRISVFPLEELLFFVVIPICALLTYEAVGRILDRARDGARS